MKRFLLMFTLLVLLVPAAAWAGEPAADTSLFTTGSTATFADPYKSFDVSLTLRDAQGFLPDAAPSGKIYIWATDENKAVSNGLDVISQSLDDGVFMHQTDRRGVLIMDAAALTKPRSFQLTLATTGEYTLHALYMPTGKIDPANVSDYWPYELTASPIAERRVTVNPTPAKDVGLIVASTRIRGIDADSFLITNPQGQTVRGGSIAVDQNGSTETDIQLALLRDNGLSVGPGVQVYATTAASGIRLRDQRTVTDQDGVAHFYISGTIAAGDTLNLRLDLAGDPVVVPLAVYSYRPETVRFMIGSPTMIVDGRTMTTDAPAVVKEGRTYVPYRAIGEQLGAAISYDPDVRTITARFDNHILTMTLGYSRYAIDGVIYQMDAAPYIAQNRTMVPIRFIGQVMGYNVQAVAGADGSTESVLFTRS
jgi:hypothetical protein